MSTNEISDNTSLTEQILQLKAERTKLEEGLSQSFSDIKQTVFNPSKTNKDEEQNGKRDVINLSKIVVNMGTDYIIEQNFGKKQNFSDFFASSVMELISVPLISKGIESLFAEIDESLSEEKSEDSN
ncbi:MAG: hypothetical protein R6U95_05495 [Bacteroidales bacterium]